MSQCEWENGGQGYDGTYEVHQCMAEAVRTMVYYTQYEPGPDRVDLCDHHYTEAMHDALDVLTTEGVCGLCNATKHNDVVKHRFGCSFAAWLQMQQAPIMPVRPDIGDAMNRMLDRALEAVLVGWLLAITIISLILLSRH